MSVPLFVVAGIILNSQREVLIAERPAGKFWAGYWEFPGGKIETGESNISALVRELREELAIDLSGEVFQHFHHGVRGNEVVLDFYLCRLSREIQPRGAEGQRWQWLDIARLHTRRFPEPNTAVLEKLQKL